LRTALYSISSWRQTMGYIKRYIFSLLTVKINHPIAVEPERWRQVLAIPYEEYLLSK
jgi:hypothetical protein